VKELMRGAKTTVRITKAVVRIGGGFGSVAITHGTNIGTDISAALSIVSGLGTLGKEIFDYSIKREKVLKRAEKRLDAFVKSYEKEVGVFRKTVRIGKAVTAGVLSEATGSLSELVVNSVGAMESDVRLLKEQTAFSRRKFGELSKKLSDFLKDQDELLAEIAKLNYQLAKKEKKAYSSQREYDILSLRREIGEVEDKLKKLEKSTGKVTARAAKFGEFIVEEEEFIEKYEKAIKTLKDKGLFNTVKGIEVGAEAATTTVKLVAGQINNDWGSVAGDMLDGIEIEQFVYEVSAKLGEKVTARLEDMMG
jgi:hypothetical protein